MKVQQVYKFTMIAGRGSSSSVRLAQSAKDIATDFFGEGEVVIEMEIEAKQAKVGTTRPDDNLYVYVNATKHIEVS